MTSIGASFGGRSQNYWRRELFRHTKWLGNSRRLRPILVASVALWVCFGLIAPAILAVDETKEAEGENVEATASPVEETAESASAPVADGESEPPAVEEAPSESGGSGQEEEPRANDNQQQKQENDRKKNSKKAQEQVMPNKHIIGATAKILLIEDEGRPMIFNARVDTGAKSCSLHVEEMKIVNEEEGWKENIGKVVRFRLRNGSDKTKPIECRIKKYVLIKTSGHVERRYKVPLTLSWNGGAVEKTVLVTLNDRNGMDYPLLLGRNFLKGDFLVDVDMDSDD